MGTIYRVEYLKKLGHKEDRGWKTIKKFDNLPEAIDYAKRCERGFGKTRVEKIEEVTVGKVVRTHTSVSYYEEV